VFVASTSVVFDGGEIFIVLTETVSHFPFLLSFPSTNLFPSKECPWNADVGFATEEATGLLFTTLVGVGSFIPEDGREE